jgi:hypothetical protein
MMEAEVMDVEPTVTVEAGKASSGSGLPTVVMPGDYRIGATLLTVSMFLGPVCHLWCAPRCAPLLTTPCFGGRRSRARAAGADGVWVKSEGCWRDPGQ